MTEEATNEVVQATQEAVKDVGQVTAYIQAHIPDLVSFGLRVVAALLFFFIGRMLIGWVRKIVSRSFARSGADKGVGQFVDSCLKIGLYLLLLVSIATQFGVDTASVAAVIASAGVAVGLALQGSLSNLAGGVLILILKPFKVGDYIIEHTNGNEGTVEEIQIFYTKLVTIDQKVIVIPNGTLTNNSLTNVSAEQKRQLDLRVGIAYESDLGRAKEVLLQILKEDAAVHKDGEIRVFVAELGESAVELGLRAWVDNEDFWPARWRILENIKLALDENGIEIPYRQVMVHTGKQK